MEKRGEKKKGEEEEWKKETKQVGIKGKKVGGKKRGEREKGSQGESIYLLVHAFHNVTNNTKYTGTTTTDVLIFVELVSRQD
jgi:tRNA A58 N-methylase Trm61